jgi:ABC-type transport system involved in cytochrome bd biosynthesis fused ATPase/permease subunit
MEVVFAIARHKPVLIVSHRLANVESASCIYVMDGGSIREKGGHAELLSAGGLYAKLHAAQRELEEFAAGGGEGEGVREARRLKARPHARDRKVLS